MEAALSRVSAKKRASSQMAPTPSVKSASLAADFMKDALAVVSLALAQRRLVSPSRSFFVGSGTDGWLRAFALSLAALWDGHAS